MERKVIKIVIVLSFILPLLISCKQSCFDVLTHNDVGYWSRYWTPNDPHGAIMEFSKNDSTTKYIDENWTYSDFSPALWGLKFWISSDTLFTYVNRKGSLMIYDTIPIASYSKKTVILKNGIVWHRLSTKYAKKMLSDQVKLSFLLKTHNHDGNITDIVGVVWKLYGYGDVSTEIVRKSESLKRDWMNIIKFEENGTMSGRSTYNNLYGKYTISGSNIVFLSFYNNNERDEDFDGYKFCDILPQCGKFKITKNWLQLFYSEGHNFLLFEVSNR